MELGKRFPQLLRAVQFNSNLRNNINFTQIRTSMYEKYRHGPNRKHNPQFDYIATIKDAFSMKAIRYVKDELKLLIRESVRHHPPTIVHPFEVYTYEHFDTDEAFNHLWTPISDSTTSDGYSKSYFERSPLDHGLFHGVLDTRVPDDGICQEAGFAALQGPRCARSGYGFRSSWDFQKFTHILLRLRGDGRTYRLVVNVSSDTDDQSWYDTFSYPIYTHGGPYWQIVKLPFSKFIFASKCYVQDGQVPMPLDRVRFIAITLNDNIDGPFRLEIDHISLTCDLRHKELCAYEQYGFSHMKRIHKSIGTSLPDP